MCDASKNLQFAHLHQHTAYSLLDGAARIKDLIAWVKEVSPDNPTVAMTDHGNMHGAVEFYKTAAAAGVKPIIGFEAYVTAGSRFEKKRGSSKLDGGYFHLTLLAKDFKGYQNLCKLNSRGWLEGFYGKPRVDHELLREYAEGVIALSGCLGAQIPRNLLDVGEAAGDEVLRQYLDIYGDNFFIELQNHVPEQAAEMTPSLLELSEQQTRLNPMLRELANKYGLGMVATNDGHYVKKEDAKAHEALLAIQTKTTLSDPNRFRFACDQFYVKTPSEMARAIPESEFPSALANSITVADMCDVTLPVGAKRVYQMPELPIPAGRTLAQQLRVQSYEGLLARYPDIDEALYRHYLAHTDSAVGTSSLPLSEVLATLAEAGEACQKTAKDEGTKYVTYPHLEKLKETAAVAAETLTKLERVEYELGVIIAMGFPDYFLIVADFINWAKDHGIAVGPGRGSGAGSIVAYALRITDIDPLEFDLLFERFLNPDRVSMPDFDVDFSDARRLEVVDYVRQKYGEEKVAQIATFGTMASKAAVRDAARVMEIPYADADAVSKLIPVVFGRSTPIKRAMEEVAEIKALYDGGASEFMDVAMNLEGLTRHASVHAAGVIIAREPVQELAPVFRSGDGPIVCQYDMGSVEDLGFIKMDFLGLRTLTFIETAIRIIKDSHGVALSPDTFPQGDAATFELLSRGAAAGVFQFESAGMVDTLKKLKPTRIQDLIAVSALYRPGPMENIPTYIRRHHGQEEVDYSGEYPVAGEYLAPILEETYGIPVYQEQIMQIAQQVAGYTLGEADLLRRAMGKKKVEEMLEQRAIFTAGAQKKGIPEGEASAIFNLLEKFANYGFNKSHSAAYGALSYQTAYLKAHYPVAFAAALLTVERGDSDKVAQYAADARSQGVEVLPPDINASRSDFTPVGDVVRFGLSGIKNVGDGAVEHILAVREEGKFKDLYDFCKRVDGSLVNKRALEHLIKAGAFDALGERSSLLANLETAMKWGAAEREQASAGQFGLFGAEESKPPEVQEAAPLTKLELLKFEKDALGLYISDHPMNSYPGLAAAASCKLGGLEPLLARLQQDAGADARHTVVLSGIMQKVQKKATRSGRMMAFFELSDASGTVEIMVFGRTYDEVGEKLHENQPVVAVVELSANDGRTRVVLDRLIPWQERHDLPRVMIAEFKLADVSESMLTDFRSSVDEHAGTTKLQLKVHGENGAALYDTDRLRVEESALAAIASCCPWLELSVTLDREQLLRSAQTRANNRFAPKPQQAVRGSAPDVPF